MELILYMSYFIGFFYFIMVSLFILGWCNIDKKNNSIHYNFNNKTIPFVSILIAAKNEEKVILKILNDLTNQNIDIDNYEIIVINDCSTDNTAKIVKELCKKRKNLKLLETTTGKQGKKAALTLGLENAKGELIITTDADCRVGKFWIDSHLDCYSKTDANLIIGSVCVKSQSFVEKVLAVEYQSLIASTAGATGINRAFMCNGANLVFRKSIVESEKDIYNKNYTSGDDVFLLHKYKKIDRTKIFYNNSENSRVFTTLPKTVKEFISQRKRWVSKSTGYKDFDAIAVSLIVFAFNLILLTLPVLIILFHYSWTNILILYSLKFIPDYIILRLSKNFLNNNFNIFYFGICFLLYPFYIVGISLLGLLKKK